MVTLLRQAPPQTEEALGYPGRARWVAFYWSPCGDEADYDDGRSSGTGNWDGFLTLIDHPRVAPRLGPLRFSLGSSDQDPTHYLLLDRKERSLKVIEARRGGLLLREQWHEGPARLEVEFENCREADDLADLFDLSGWVELPIDDEEVNRRLARRQLMLEEMVAFLDKSA